MPATLLRVLLTMGHLSAIRAIGCTLARVIRHAIERHRAQEQLRQREEFFRLIAENIDDMVAVLDESGRRIYTHDENSL